MTTVGELRAIINDPDVADDVPLRVRVTNRGYLVSPLSSSTCEWRLVGAAGTLAGDNSHLTLELESP